VCGINRLFWESAFDDCVALGFDEEVCRRLGRNIRTPVGQGRRDRECRDQVEEASRGAKAEGGESVAATSALRHRQVWCLFSRGAK
jgi:hypothetical protein